MRIWKRLAIASAIAAAAAAPAWAGGGYGQTQDDQAVTPSTQATPTPTWDGQRTYGNSSKYHRSTKMLPGSTITSPDSTFDSAADESHATGKVDAGQAAPPQTGADVQPGDMGPSSAKGQ